MDLVRCLLEHGARVLSCDNIRDTSLMLAASQGFRAICELLLTQETGDC